MCYEKRMAADVLQVLIADNMMNSNVCMINPRFVRAEVLAGFINGLFLMFIAFFIFSEAIEVCLYTSNKNLLLANTYHH